MQTFLTNYDLEKNASVLDNKRLFKQLLEAKQMLDCLVNNKKGWSSHPAVLQWKGCETGLYIYIQSIWKRCQKRKIAKDSKLMEQSTTIIGNFENVTLPFWWGREDIISSHKSRLLCKGFVDLLVDNLKRHVKVRKVDKYLKELYGKTKNQFRYEDAKRLCDWFSHNNYEVTGNNHYDQFGWSESPDMDYVWPVQKT